MRWLPAVALIAAAALSPLAFGAAPGRAAAKVSIDDPDPLGAPEFAVGEIFVTYVDESRHVQVNGREAPRTLTTVIRYPAVGDPSQLDVPSAAPARAAGPFPLIVFGHGFDTTPAPYARLLQAWARAGYVVAAPIFPLSNANAPGGPDEADLVNQPADMSFVIGRILAGSARRRGILSSLVDGREVAVSGQSDGGSTALAAAYNTHDQDPRVRAAVILSGAKIPGLSGYRFSPPGPPLLASQGTGDTVNAPASTYHFFNAARPPKFLLSLLGAPHLGPYTSQEPQLGIVERVTVAFLDRYLKQSQGARARLWRAGNVPHRATLTATAPQLRS